MSACAHCSVGFKEGKNHKQIRRSATRKRLNFIHNEACFAQIFWCFRRWGKNLLLLFTFLLASQQREVESIHEWASEDGKNECWGGVREFISLWLGKLPVQSMFVSFAILRSVARDQSEITFVTFEQPPHCAHPPNPLLYLNPWNLPPLLSFSSPPWQHLIAQNANNAIKLNRRQNAIPSGFVLPSQGRRKSWFMRWAIVFELQLRWHSSML